MLRVFLFFALCSAGLAGCGGDDRLSDLPFPSLAGLDPAVATQLRAVEGTLRATVSSDATDQEQATVFGNAAEAYHAHAFFFAAEGFYERAVKLAPGTPRWKHLLGLVQTRAGKLDAARTTLMSARDLSPSTVATRVALAEVFYQRNEHDLCRAEYQEALKLEPKCAPALYGYGRVLLMNDNDADEAILHLERALELQPGATRIHYPLGLAYRAIGERSKATLHLGQAGTVSPSCPDPWKTGVDQRRTGDRLAQNRGTMLFRAGRYTDAKREFESAIRSNPKNGLAHGHLASTLAKLGDLTQSLQSLGTALELAPNDPTINYNMGTFLARARRDEEAIPFYRRSLESDPRSTQTHFNLANAYRRTRQWAESIEEFTRVIEDEPSNADALFGRIVALTQSRQYEAAAQACKTAIQATDDLRIQQALARLLAAAPEDGVRNGVMALEIAVRLREAHKTLEHLEVEAMALAETGYFNDAMTIQQRIITVARRENREDLVRSLEKNFIKYRKGTPARRPWERESMP